MVEDVGILGVAAYFSSNPSAPRWQILGIASIAVATLAIGGTAAALYDEGNKEVREAPTAVASVPANGSSTPAPAGAAEIIMEDNKFTSGEISVASGATINITNKGVGTHNVPVAAAGSYAVAFCKTTGTEPCSKPATIPGSGTATMTVTLAAGTYDFRCDFHPTEMRAKLTVK